MIDKVFIMPEVRKKMQAYIDTCNLEISGLGTVDVVDGQAIVTDIYLIKQEVSLGYTRLDPASLADFMVEAHTKGVDMAKIKFWWHSHVNGSAYWSVVDNDNIDGLRPDGFFISTVGNKKGETRTRIDIYKPFRCMIDDLPLVDVPTPKDQALYEAVKAEVREKVTALKVKKAPTVFYPQQFGYNVSKLGSNQDEDPWNEGDYMQFADGMGMSVDDLLAEEGKVIKKGRVVSRF